MNYVEEILDFFIKSGSSDLHLSVDKPPMVRLHGKMEVISNNHRNIEMKDIEEFMNKYQEYKLDEYQKFLNNQIFSIDSSFSFHDRRFRIHIYKSFSGVVIVFRILQEEIPTIESLFLPSEVNLFTTFRKGLLLVTGPTGSGKSTTLAAILNKINHEQKKVMVTVEDPIEYMYKEDKCRIEQREVGIHVSSFGDATRDMMREDPDIILVGEMRDIETIKNAITLSETGHLVFATLHTKSVADSVDRIIDIFPAEQQQQVRVQLSYILLGVLNQNLVKGNTGMVPLSELLILNPVTSSLLRQGKNNATLRDYIRSANNGSVHLIDNVAWHIKNNRINLETCKEFLSNSDIEVLVNILENSKTEKSKKGVVYSGTRRF